MAATRRIARALGTVVMMAILLFSAMVLVLPRLTDGAALTVLSGSMEPTYPVGSMLFVRSVDPADVRAGDVITYQNSPDSPSFTTHRVVQVERTTDGTSFVTKGDANRSEDRDPVPAGAVRGRVWFHIPWAGLLRDRAASPWGLATIALLVLGVTYHDRIRIWPGSRRRHPAAGDESGAEPSAPPPVPQRVQKEIPTLDNHLGMVAAPLIRSGQHSSSRITAQVLLAQVATTPLDRAELLQLIGIIGGRVETISRSHVALSVTATPEALDAIVTILEPYDVVARARSSTVEFDFDNDTYPEQHAGTGAGRPEDADVTALLGRQL